MHMNSRVPGQEILYGIGFMRGEVVGNHVDFFGFGLTRHNLTQEINKLSTAMTLSRFAQDLTRARVEGSVEREGAVTKILKAMTLGASGGKWQHRVFSIQCLNSCFLIDGKYRRMLRRIHIQPNNIGGLTLKFRVIARQIAVQTVRLEPVFSPDPGNRHMRTIPEFN